MPPFNACECSMEDGSTNLSSLSLCFVIDSQTRLRHRQTSILVFDIDEHALSDPEGDDNGLAQKIILGESSIVQFDCSNSSDDNNNKISAMTAPLSSMSLSPPAVQQQQQQQKRKRVRFDTVEVREYPLILGSNPCVSSGAPLTLDWQFMSCTTNSVEGFENARKRVETRGNVFRKDALEREIYLRSLGYSVEELMNVQRGISIIQQSRRESLVDRDEQERLQSLITRARRSNRRFADYSPQILAEIRAQDEVTENKGSPIMKNDKKPLAYPTKTIPLNNYRKGRTYRVKVVTAKELGTSRRNGSGHMLQRVVQNATKRFHDSTNIPSFFMKRKTTPSG